MKNIRQSVCYLLFIALSACSSDVEPPPTPDPWHGQTKILSLETYYYNSANEQPKPEKAFVTIDSVNHTITTWIEHSIEGGGFQRREFDQNWRLIKIVNQDKSYAQEERRDSIMISRLGPGIFDFISSNGAASRYIITATPDGGKLIQQVKVNDDPKYFHRRIIDKNGYLTYSGFYQLNGDNLTREFHHLTYNGNGQLTGVRDTAYYSDANIYAFQHTITKSDVLCPQFINLMKQMAGTDLDWTLYDPYNPVPVFRLTYEFSNLVVLQNGAFLKNALDIRVSNNGGTSFQPGEVAPPLTYEFTSDLLGRLTYFTHTERGYISKKMKFSYFD